MKLEQVKFIHTVGALPMSNLLAKETDAGIECNQGFVTFSVKGKPYVVPVASNVMWMLEAAEKTEKAAKK